jgi:hypothetical protein
MNDLRTANASRLWDTSSDYFHSPLTPWLDDPRSPDKAGGNPEALGADLIALFTDGVENFTGSARASLAKAWNWSSILDGDDGVAAPAPFVPLPGGPTSLYIQGTGDAAAIDKNDVNQNDLGDCYFLASVAALARSNPAAISNMIRENRDAAGNVVSYTVSLWDKESSWFGLRQKNKLKEITVDNNFPASGRANPGDVDGAGNQEIWPMILEKAFAQMKGGYAEIGEGGRPEKAMFALTGRDAHSYSPWRVNNYDLLKNNFDAGKMMTFSTPDWGKKDVGEFGLHGNHAYTISGFHTDASGQRYIDLQTPWGVEHASVPFEQFARVCDGIQIG